MALGLLFAFIIIITLMLVGSSLPIDLRLVLFQEVEVDLEYFIAGIIVSTFIAFIFFEPSFCRTKQEDVVQDDMVWCLISCKNLEIFIILFPLL